MTQSSEQLEQEAERNRAQLAETLDEIRSRMSPGQVLDQFVQYSRDSGAGEFARNLGRQVKANPLPLTLMGASIAWLAMANGRSSSASWPRTGAGGYKEARDKAANYVGATGQAAQQAGESLSSTAEGWSDAMSDTAARASDYMSDKAAQATEYGQRIASAAGDAGNRASSTFGAAAHAVGDSAAAVGRSTTSLGRGAADASQSFLEFCREQPVVSGALGLAIGAVLGALFPSTRAENLAMGETSDQLKEKASSLASDQYEKAKSVASAAASEAKQESERQGLGRVSAEQLTEEGERAPGIAPVEHPGELSEFQPDRQHDRS